MRCVQHTTERLADVARAVRRPATYGGHVRELASTAVTVGLWPTGVFDFGVADLDAVPDGSPVATPVLLVHGFGANKSNWLLVRQHLEQVGFGRISALNYNPLRADIPTLAERCVARAREVMDHYGADRIHLVGHSLGGIVARYATQVLGLREAGVCVTVASPHGGVRVARYGSVLSRVSPLSSGLQLRPDSTVMTRLRWTAEPSPTRYVAYYANLDLIVPARRAMILEPALDATNILVKDTGHLSIMLSRRLAASIADQLAAAEGLPGYGAPIRPLHPGAATASRVEDRPQDETGTDGR